MGYRNLFEFYRSSEWVRLRQQMTLGRVDGSGDLRCEGCGKVIIHPYDAICHHVQELDEMNVHDVNIALNPDNIQVLCHKCHNKVHDRWQGGNGGTRHVYIIHGSPCAGKAEYVRNSAGAHDLIVDIDKLYDAVGMGDRGAVKSNVMRLYRDLIDMVKTRQGRWKTAWIIRTLPLKMDRESLVKEIGGGELVHIDTDHDTCLMEAHRRGGDWIEWVQQYWDRYQA